MLLKSIKDAVMLFGLHGKMFFYRDDSGHLEVEATDMADTFMCDQHAHGYPGHSYLLPYFMDNTNIK